MANIFERVRDALNTPLPGAPGKKDDKKKEGKKDKKAASDKAKPEAEQINAPDVQTQLRERQLEIRRARKKARDDAKVKRELDQARKELEDLRKSFEAEIAKEAKAHEEREEWTHTVVPGDTLSGIAKKYYGNAAKWPEIFEANKDRIENPNLIYPGQVFVIPDDEDED